MKAKNNKAKENIKNKESNEKSIITILTYSALEQGRNKITGIGRSLLFVLGIFPFAPICLNLINQFMVNIDSDTYTLLLVIFVVMELLLMGIYVYKMTIAIITVYLINENAEIYSLRISTFWYKIKDKMYLIKPVGMRVGKLSMLMYMIGNIKIVLENVADEVTYEEFITMGKMKGISDISNVTEGKKYIKFWANEKTNKGIKRKHIKIPKVYEKIDVFKVFLETVDAGDIEKARTINFNEKKNINELMMPLNSRRDKVINKSLNWTFIMAWLTALTRLYKNNFIVWISFEIIYLVTVFTDVIIEKIKKNKNV